MAGDEFVIRIVDGAGDVSPDGAKPKGGGSSMLGALGKFGAIGAGIGVGATLTEPIVSALSGLLKPIQSLLGGIVKIIGELLRPIVEVITIILRPILMIVKPLVDLFKSFLAPFMNIAREFGRISQSRAAAGDMAGSIEAAIASAQAVLGPFVVGLLSVALQLVLSVAGGLISTVLNNVISLIQPILAVIPFVGDAINSGLEKAKTGISDGISAAINYANQGLTAGTQTILNAMLNDAQARLDAFKGRYPADYANTFIEQPVSSLQESATQVDTALNGANGIAPAFKTGTDTMQSDLAKAMGENGSIIGVWNSGLSKMEKNLSDFFKQIESNMPKASSSSSKKDSYNVKVAGITVGKIVKN